MPAVPFPARSPEDPHDQPLAAVRAGRPGAWDELYRRYRGLVLASARRRGVTPEQAEDVAQSTWLQLVRNQDRIRDDRCLPAWLMVTAGREAGALLRRQGRERPTPDVDPADPAAADDTDDVLSAVDASGVAAALHAAVRDLPDRERRLVEQLLAPDQPSYREISRRLGMPVGAIGPVRARALARLRRALTPVDRAA